MKTTVAHAIVKMLELEGIKYAFGITGSHLLCFMAAIRDSGLQFVSLKHEAAAGYAAYHYAKASQKPALVVATAGPGAANLINGISNLYKSGMPAFVFTPCVPMTCIGKNAFQEDSGYGKSYSLTQLMSNITRRALLSMNAQTAIDDVRELLRCALTPPYGPVHLSVPTDVLSQLVEWDELDPSQYRLVEDERIEIEKIHKLAVQIKGSISPILFIGNRCVYPECSAQLSNLIEETKIPFITSFGAKGLLGENSSCFAGVLDYFGHRSAEVFIKSADLVVAIGANFSESETLNYDRKIFANRNLITIDSWDSYIGTNFPITFGICGSIGHTLNHLNMKLTGWRYAGAKSTQTQYLQANTFQEQQMKRDCVPLQVSYVLSQISMNTTDSVVVVDGSAVGVSSTRHFLSVNKNYIPFGAAASIGDAVPGVIGTKLADPEKIVFCICGDGGFLTHSNEVLTAVHYKLGIGWIVFCDGLYNMIDINQKMAYNDSLSFCTQFKNPDFELLARAYGAEFCEIKVPEDIGRKIEFAKHCIRASKPIIISVTYDFHEHLPIKPRLVETMRDLGQTIDIQSNPYLMRAFKLALKEKV